MVNGFLLGVIATTSLIAALFFFKFWRRTGDFLFLAFGLAFAIEGCNRIAMLLSAHPNEGATGIYLVRLFAFLLILAAILKKNFGASNH